jgi:hypothetical protein
MTSPRPACDGVATEQFYGRDGESGQALYTRLREVARRYCAGCPIYRACRAQGYRNNEQGMWGGVFHARYGDARYRHVDLLTTTTGGR